MHVPTSPNGAHPNGRGPTLGTNGHPAARPDTTPPSANGGRDGHGRFAEGNRGGPGNPFARQVAALRSALLARITPQDIWDVAEALLRQAKEGNVAAARLLLSYTLGKPAAPVDPDTLDAQEWEGYQRVPDPGADLAVMAQRMPLGLACTMGRAMLTGLTSDWRRQLAEGFARDKAERQRKAERRAKRPPSANGPGGAGGNPRRPSE